MAPGGEGRMRAVFGPTDQSSVFPHFLSENGSAVFMNRMHVSLYGIMCFFPGMDLEGLHPDLPPLARNPTRHLHVRHVPCHLKTIIRATARGPHTNMMRTMAFFCPAKIRMGHPCQGWIQREHLKFREPGPVPGTLLSPVHTVGPCIKMSVFIQNNP